METNLFYDRIVNLHKQYINHVAYVDNKRKDFAERKKEIAQKLIDSGTDEEVSKISFEVFIEDKLHANDINLLFNQLFHLVEAYSELDGAITLPKAITELCSDYSSIVMKTMFVVNDSLICSERVAGSIDKIKKTLEYTGEIQNMTEQFKKLIEVGK